MPRIPSLLLNLGHALDHLFLLIFATAVGAIAVDFGIAHWEDLMPYSVGAFLMFGIGSIPAGHLGDTWGRRRMMLVFFFGMALSAFAAAATRSPGEMALALTLLGLFSSIYHPVGIPMLVRDAQRPGMVIGINGLAGNLGIAFAALLTGILVKYSGWRMAFVVPGLVSLLAGCAFALCAPDDRVGADRGKPAASGLSGAEAFRVVTVMAILATASALIFNFTTNGNAQFLAERMHGIVTDPAAMGILLAGIYTVGSLAQILIGRLIDRVPIKTLLFSVIAVQVLAFACAATARGWSWYALMILCMIGVFGAIPFNDAMVVRYVDDRLRSRVSGMRLAIAFGISSLAVYVLGPVVKTSGFEALMIAMSIVAALSGATVFLLPDEAEARRAAAVATSP